MTRSNSHAKPTLENPTKYCCCFIPSRFGLLSICLLALAWSLCLAVIAIFVLQRFDSILMDFPRLVLYLHVFVSAFFALFCCVGIYASISRRPTLTSLFTSLVIGQFIFSLASGGMCLYILFEKHKAFSVEPTAPSTTAADDLGRCLALARDAFTRVLCNRSPAMQAVVANAFGVMWLLEIVSAFVGNMFLTQLREEQMELELMNPKFGDGTLRC